MSAITAWAWILDRPSAVSCADAGQCFAAITGLTLKRASKQALFRTGLPDDDEWLHAIVWQQKDRSKREPEPVRWLIVADATGVGDELGKRLQAHGHTCAL